MAVTVQSPPQDWPVTPSGPNVAPSWWVPFKGLDPDYPPTDMHFALNRPWRAFGTLSIRRVCGQGGHILILPSLVQKSSGRASI